MKKEVLTIQNVKQDLRRIAAFHLSNKADVRFAYIVPCTLGAIVVGILLHNVWIALAIFSLAAYHIVRYVIEYKKYRAQKRAIRAVLERGDVSVSVERLSHIAQELIYEPHAAGRQVHETKTVTFYHFEGGNAWRLPRVDRHYEWSAEYALTSRGLDNVSLVGDEFFYVSLQGYADLVYIYPCKFFVLDEALKQKNKD